MSALGWVALGVAGWLLVATVVGMVIGRTIRLRDRSLSHPQPEDPRPETDPSASRCGC
jgi:hypothetical protein